MSLRSMAVAGVALASAAIVISSLAPQKEQPLSATPTDESPAIQKLAVTTTAEPGNANATSEALAQHLKGMGAKMYGAFWCSFCKLQKQLFGNAVQQINYVECDPRGKNSQPSLCQQAGVRAFPTWEINGKFYPGVKSLQELALLSGYRGQY